MIKVNNLSYSYKNSGRCVLENLNFNIKAGEIFGFLGPSGAGKSTTQKILYKILNDFNGNVVIDDQDIKSTGYEFYEKIGVGFELPNHYMKLTAMENLQLFSSFYQQAQITNLEELFDLVGLTEHRHQRVESYSKGMQMRLNFIRAIMHDPEIIFFDEPTAGLDPINSTIIKNHILKLKQAGKTLFITTHDMTIADQLCDRVAFLVNGEIM